MVIRVLLEITFATSWSEWPSKITSCSDREEGSVGHEDERKVMERRTSCTIGKTHAITNDLYSCV